MACKDVSDAITWSASGSTYGVHCVAAYFTKHSGVVAQMSNNQDHKDTVHYAVGCVHAMSGQTTPHLAGTLKVYKNEALDDGMELDSSLTYYVEIFEDGTLSYLMKVNGQPVGPPTTINATCVNDSLLTAVSGNEVVTVGVYSVHA